ncbi:MAG: ABC transporter ATP-binding protein [Oscillospiraceae bacterium]|jgi:multidrug/hemolysin transport system ATP-binding protein|nr:ABC transporter ATP-binding protein [Oscillospiraceae bacterium]
MRKLIAVEGLHKSYGSIKAVNGLDFYVEEGTLFAFLGPNGAGKSTTIDILCTFLKPDAGKISVGGFTLGKDDSEIRKIIGAVFQNGVLDALLTVEENLRVRGGFYGLKGQALKNAGRAAAETTGVTELLKRPYGKLSGGQRRRCDIARALINTPKLLFLDEPTAGLDPQTRKYIWDTISGIRKKNDMTIFLTTHYMEEAAGADYVVVIDNGEISAKGTPSELKERYSNDRLVLSARDTGALASALREQGLPFKAAADTLTLALSATRDALPVIDGCRGLFDSFEVIKGTMDDAFIAITGKELRE